MTAVRPPADLGDLLVAVLIRQVHQLPEGDHPDAELFGCIARPAPGRRRGRRTACPGVLAGAGVIAADDQVVGAVVAADDRVPQRLARAGQAHRQRQQGQQDAVRVVVAASEGLVGAHAGVVIDVAGLGHANHRVEQQHAIHLLDGALGQFLVDAVQRVARLEGDDVGVADLRQAGAGLRRGQAQVGEVVVRGQLAARAAGRRY